VPAGSDALGALGARLGFPFRDAAVLGLVVAEHLWRLDPGASEGTLTPKRAALISGSNLARWAADVELGTALRVGRGEGQTGGREKESVLATAFEAVLAVIYLEGGLDAARRTVAARALW
jgi:ribonuclease-3